MVNLYFVNSFSTELPGATLERAPQLTPNICYAEISPKPVCRPNLLLFSEQAARLIGLEFSAQNESEMAEIFSGNRVLTGMRPIATRYGGFQFGHWAGQLGDGRAILLGEVEAKGRWEIQLKGAGITPYSRRGDGRAVLRSSLREFLCSEAMFNLNIPTTRALCCITTGEKVVRDMFYDGHPEEEPGAITTRMAPSFLRFGHYEVLAKSGEIDLLKKLADYTIRNFYPHFMRGESGDYVLWFKEICKRSSHLVLEWLRVGFVHGVMNTDNMSILGLTMDYGPYGWLDIYDPDWTPNTSDSAHKRYRFSNQANIMFWNLCRLAEAISPLVSDAKEIKQALEEFKEEFPSQFYVMLSQKIGITKMEGNKDIDLIKGLEEVLSLVEMDYTIFYRVLANLHGSNDLQKIWAMLTPSFYSKEISEPKKDRILLWVQAYLLRMSAENPLEIKNRMNEKNPFFILRNYLVQEALDELSKGNDGLMRELMQAMQTPYMENEKTKKFFARRPEWAREKPGCSALSCSS